MARHAHGCSVPIRANVSRQVQRRQSTTKNTKSTNRSENKTLDAILQFGVVEIDQPFDLYASQFHIGQQLGLVNSLDSVDTPESHNKFISTRMSIRYPQSSRTSLYSTGFCIPPIAVAGVGMRSRFDSVHAPGIVRRRIPATPAPFVSELRWHSRSYGWRVRQTPSFVLFVSFVVKVSRHQGLDVANVPGSRALCYPRFSPGGDHRDEVV